MNPPMIYTVKDVCSLAGVSRKTLFYYDRIGLLSPSERKGKQRSRLYTDAEIHTLERIRYYQKAGLRLSEISSLLNEPDQDHSDIFQTVIDRLSDEMKKAEETIRLCEKAREEYEHASGKMPGLRNHD